MKKTKYRVKVPDLPTQNFIRLAAELLQLTYVDEDFAEWDFFRGERGMTYEVGSWTPERTVNPAVDVRRHFKKCGFKGNVAAFIAWLMERGLRDRCATVPSDGRMFRMASGLYVPHTMCRDEDRKLCLHRCADAPWETESLSPWRFLAFKRVKP